MSTWSFKGTPFRRMDPDGQARSWPAKLTVTVDVVAGDVGTVPRRYVDLGAVEHEAWPIKAGCPELADRDALVAARYSTGALVTIGGASYQALCTKATPLTHDGGALYYAELEFVLLS
jgi:hypothetical protein